MKTFLVLVFSLVLSVFSSSAHAQEQGSAWIQIEALRTLADGEARARSYAASFPNVAGFRVGGRWYAVALGPYTPAAASAELGALKRGRLIPQDSYIAYSNQYEQQFWPVGANALLATPQDTVLSPLAQPEQTDQPLAQEPVPPAYIPDETPGEARASERALDAAQRMLLQESLKWEGFYDAAIDGSFGAGTRRAMAAWQEAKGYDATGVLTTRQRTELVGDYRSPFADLGLASVRDDAAGIEMILPTGKVKYSRAEAPFVHYDSTDEDEVQVILISQSGDEATLFGLYDIMQTLEMVPTEGFRERKKQSFVLTGQSSTLNSYSYAELKDGAIKGFTVSWKPGGDARVMERVVNTMQESFAPVEGIVLPDNALSGDGSDQRIDLMAGLKIRRPERSRSGFYIDETGKVLTTTDVLGQCARITIGEEIEADVTSRDDTLGLALLTPRQSLRPLAVAEFQGSVPRLNSEVTLAGFSYEDILDLPVLTFGTLADIRGLQGEEFVERLALSALPGDAGGPVFDTTGAVLGMLRARNEQADKQLPPDVNFAVDVPAIADFLGQAGLSPRAAVLNKSLAPEDLVTLAGDVTVRISCWN
ncbi:trypsin-like peptidase domain-containing protein [Aliiruegeria lutimaris]|uniref:Putative peptidoglycan binding domain-containing protein n=1 Tax=Aliiruegeria lutimaris TaxID=571298 RepID=A0A1G8MV92_9RHOB|nr:trypsin-like peptidase domain-containing protein [Aliiruegeria lutimaris]SDI71948.1 Putative peptidoglycan binding domain-containing protein [Aliiruegeria lutimaris]